MFEISKHLRTRKVVVKKKHRTLSFLKVKIKCRKKKIFSYDTFFADKYRFSGIHINNKQHNLITDINNHITDIRHHNNRQDKVAVDSQYFSLHIH